MTIGKKSLLSIALTGVMSTAFAEDDPKHMDNYLSMSLEQLLSMELSVASTKPETVFNSMSTVSIISRQQIDAYGYATVADALVSLSGLDVARTFQKRNLPTARGVLQDNYANKVLVMIDNVPTWHAVTGEASLEHIALRDVERIEVLKGPASVLYGTNAYTGAINIVLRSALRSDAEFALGVGNHDARQAGASWSTHSENAGIYISAHSQRSARQDMAMTDETGVTDTFTDFLDDDTFLLKAHYQNHNVMLNAFRSDEGFLGNVPRFSGGMNQMERPEGVLLNYGFQHAYSDDADLRYRLTYDWQRRVFSRDDSDTLRTDVWGYRVSNELKYNT